MFGVTILVPIAVKTITGADVLSIPVAWVSFDIGALICLIRADECNSVYLGI